MRVFLLSYLLDMLLRLYYDERRHTQSNWGSSWGQMLLKGTAKCILKYIGGQGGTFSLFTIKLLLEVCLVKESIWCLIFSFIWDNFYSNKTFKYCSQKMFWNLNFAKNILHAIFSTQWILALHRRISYTR